MAIPMAMTENPPYGAPFLPSAIADMAPSPILGPRSEGSERGVNPGIEDSYNPNNASTQAFDIAFLKVDSDKASKLPQQHGGAKILEKSPDTPIIYILEWNRVENMLLWHVIYGSRDGTEAEGGGKCEHRRIPAGRENLSQFGKEVGRDVLSLRVIPARRGFFR